MSADVSPQMLNSMLKASHVEEGVCYTTQLYRRHVVMSMLAQSYRIFAPTSRIRKLDLLAERVNPRTKGEMTRSSRLLFSLDVPVVDAFRITTCFENLFKARLLLRGWLIHQIAGTDLSDLARRQRTHPVRISSLKRREGVLHHRDIGYEFRSLTPRTLQWSTLVGNSAYRAEIRLPDRLFDALAPFAGKRNTLHFLALDSSLHNSGVVEDLRIIRNSFNRFVVRSHNRLVTQLGFPALHFKAEL